MRVIRNVVIEIRCVSGQVTVTEVFLTYVAFHILYLFYLTLPLLAKTI